MRPTPHIGTNTYKWLVKNGVPLVFWKILVIMFVRAPVAQWIMQQISNLWIAGSSPAGRARNKNKNIARCDVFCFYRWNNGESNQGSTR